MSLLSLGNKPVGISWQWQVAIIVSIISGLLLGVEIGRAAGFVHSPGLLWASALLVLCIPAGYYLFAGVLARRS